MKTISTMERNQLILKKGIGFIQTSKPSWAIEIKNKLVDLDDRSRRNNLRINGIKERKNETWEECEERVNCFLKEKLDIDTSDIWNERTHRIGEKKLVRRDRLLSHSVVINTSYIFWGVARNWKVLIFRSLMTLAKNPLLPGRKYGKRY